MVKAFEIALTQLGKEPKSIKQTLIEYLENTDLTKKGVWRFTFLPEGLDNPQISDLIRIEIDDETGHSSAIKI